MPNVSPTRKVLGSERFCSIPILTSDSRPTSCCSQIYRCDTWRRYRSSKNEPRRKHRSHLFKASNQHGRVCEHCPLNKSAVNKWRNPMFTNAFAEKKQMWTHAGHGARHQASSWQKCCFEKNTQCWWQRKVEINGFSQISIGTFLSNYKYLPVFLHYLRSIPWVGGKLVNCGFGSPQCSKMNSNDIKWKTWKMKVTCLSLERNSIFFRLGTKHLFKCWRKKIAFMIFSLQWQIDGSTSAIRTTLFPQTSADGWKVSDRNVIFGQRFGQRIPVWIVNWNLFTVFDGANWSASWFAWRDQIFLTISFLCFLLCSG